MSIFAARSRNSYPALATQYRNVYSRTLTLAYSETNLGLTAHRARHAKSGYVILGRGQPNSAANYVAACAAIRSANPHCRIMHYVIQTQSVGYREIANSANEAAMLALGAALNDVTYRVDTGTYWRCNTAPGDTVGKWTSGTSAFPWISQGTFTFEGLQRDEKLSTNHNWMLRSDTATGATRTYLSSAGSNLHNIGTDAVDASGRTFQQWLSEYYYTGTTGCHTEGGLDAYIDGIWMDNCKIFPIQAGDIDQDGDLETATDAQRITWASKGHNRFFEALRRIRPTALIHGNSQIENPLSRTDDFYGYGSLNRLDGGMYEYAGSFGASPNQRTLHGEGWAKMFSNYQLLTDKLVQNKAVSLLIELSANTAYQEARMAIATALLGDGTSGFFVSNFTTLPPEFDEGEALLGAPIEPSPTAATTGNIWTRKYENGLVVVNGGSVNATGLFGMDRGNWAASTAYSLNEYVNNGGVLYRCNTGHTSGGSFVGTNWTAVPWATATSYAAGQRVYNGTQQYVCRTAHTSGASLATDVAAGYWHVFPTLIGTNYVSGLAETYTPAAGVYRHITATQDTTANPQSGGVGAVVTGALSINAWDGRILLCVNSGEHS